MKYSHRITKFSISERIKYAYYFHRLMESGKIYLVISVVIIIAISSGCIDGEVKRCGNDELTDTIDSDISIACWNLQIFGPSKSSNATLIEYYVDKLDDYDIFIVQEIRDATGDAIETLAMGFPEHQYILSNRAGQSSSKEQYTVFYNDQATLMDYYDYQEDFQDVMQRPPLKVTFTSNNWTFTIYTVHTQPDNVAGELSVM